MAEYASTGSENKETDFCSYGERRDEYCGHGLTAR